MHRGSGIYEIVNRSGGKRYVGSAVNLQRRWDEHRSLLARNRHHSPHLQSAWAKHGAEDFEFRVLVVCDRPMLLTYEQAALDALSPEYNVQRVAGSSLGRKHSDETKAKIAAKAQGRTFSAESLAKRSATVTGRKLAPEHAAKLVGNKHALGHRHSDEWKAAISALNTGVARPKSLEHRAKIAAALRGRKATPEARANQAAAQLGKTRGPYRKAT